MKPTEAVLTVEPAAQEPAPTAPPPPAQEQANGTQPLTSEERLAVFQRELEALTNKYSVRLVPYLVRFNDGTQLADAKYILVEK